MTKGDIFFIILFAFILASVIYLKPEITGYGIINPLEHYLGMSFTENSSFVVNISGELSGMALSGNLSGGGNSLVYFDNLIILNKSANCTEVIECTKIRNITVRYNGEKIANNVSIYQKKKNKIELVDVEELINNTFTTDEIPKQNKEIIFAIWDENISLGKDELSSCNISKGNFSILECGRKCYAKLNCTEVIFENECIETCKLDRGYNKTMYNLTVVVEDSELFLDRLSYTLFIDNATENNETNVTESITLLALIPNQTWEKNTNKTNAINLDDHFNGSSLRYNYSGNEVVNISINDSIVSFYQPANWFGNNSARFTAYNNFSSLEGNEVLLVVTDVIQAPSAPSSGGGGGGGSSEAKKTEEVIQEKKVINKVETTVKETCNDGIRNQDEVGIDCGGVCKECVIDKVQFPTGMSVYIGKIFGNLNYNLIVLVSLLLLLAYFYKDLLKRLFKIKFKKYK